MLIDTACREKTMDSVVRSVDQMHGSQITRGIGRVSKTIRETVKLRMS